MVFINVSTMAPEVYFMLKKLVYKSHYRGTKEGDFLLSSFAKLALSECSDAEHEIYANLLEHNDTQIHEWVLNPQIAPKQFQEIILKIADFHGL